MAKRGGPTQHTQEASAERDKPVPDVITPPPKAEKASVSKRAKRLLDEMRGNPRGDWRIEDIEKACRQLDMNCEPPSRGTHYKVTSPMVAGVLTIPAHRPVKPCYIRQFVSLADAHIKYTEEADNG